jgi:NADPH2:quinone reductase
MRAIVCHDFPAPLRLNEVPAPSVGPGEVAVQVEACGVNFVDGLITTGRYQIKPALTHIPGFDVAGVIGEVGQGVDGVAVGDRVFATSGLAGGGYAERVVVDQSQVFRLPQSMTLGQGATFVQSYYTALFALTQRIQLEAGSTLLVLGASGGVWRAAVDIGVALGARVIAGASSDERLDACADIGPHGLINYGVDDLKTRAREFSDGGVNVVYDP